MTFKEMLPQIIVAGWWTVLIGFGFVTLWWLLWMGFRRTSFVEKTWGIPREHAQYVVLIFLGLFKFCLLMDALFLVFLTILNARINP